MGFRANGVARCSGLWSRWVTGGGVVPDAMDLSVLVGLGPAVRAVGARLPVVREVDAGVLAVIHHEF
jgi:hypothetical protein